MAVANYQLIQAVEVTGLDKEQRMFDKLWREQLAGQQLSFKKQQQLKIIILTFEYFPLTCSVLTAHCEQQ